MIHALICTEASNMQLCYKLTSTLQRIVKVHILQKQVHINFTSLHIQADVCKKKTKWRIIQAAQAHRKLSLKHYIHALCTSFYITKCNTSSY